MLSSPGKESNRSTPSKRPRTRSQSRNSDVGECRDLGRAFSLGGSDFETQEESQFPDALSYVDGM